MRPASGPDVDQQFVGWLVVVCSPYPTAFGSRPEQRGKDCDRGCDSLSKTHHMQLPLPSHTDDVSPAPFPSVVTSCQKMHLHPSIN